METGRTWTEDPLPSRVLTIVLANVAQLYPSAEGPIRMVCRAWRSCAPVLSRNPLEAAAGDGFVGLVDFFTKDEEDLKDPNVLGAAAEGGHLDVINHIGDLIDPLKVYRKIVEVPKCMFNARPLWFMNIVDRGMKLAGIGGNMDVVKLLVNWVPSTRAVIECMVNADVNDHADVVDFLSTFKWDSGDSIGLVESALQRDAVRCVAVAYEHTYIQQDTFMLTASSKGSIKCLRFGIEKKYGLNANDCLRGAASAGHIDVMRILWNELGADAADHALIEASQCDHGDAMRVAVNEFGATEVDRALLVAASVGNCAAMCVARELGATNFIAALKRSRGYRACVWDLLIEWIAEGRCDICGAEERDEEPASKRSRHE